MGRFEAGVENLKVDVENWWDLDPRAGLHR